MRNMDGGNWKEMFNAACDGDLELVRYHVERGVDVNYAHPEFLSTPLVACVLAGQESVALYLLASGAAPGLHSEFDGLTPMQAARQARLPRLEAKLVELGVAPLAAAKAQGHWLGRIFARNAA
jgi:hypothetical protein